MNVLICTRDEKCVHAINDAISAVLESKFATKEMPLNYQTTFYAKTKTNSRNETKIYIMSGDEPFEYQERLERLARWLIKNLLLSEDQVIVCSKLPVIINR